jgi:hypothetical protein
MIVTRALWTGSPPTASRTRPATRQSAPAPGLRPRLRPAITSIPMTISNIDPASLEDLLEDLLNGHFVVTFFSLQMTTLDALADVSYEYVISKSAAYTIITRSPGKRIFDEWQFSKG